MPITRKEVYGDQELLVNDYTIHSSIKQLYEIEKEGKTPLLFVDELNRSESAVLQEMMQLLLAKEINGNPLPATTLLLAAGNPSLTEEGVDYHVNEMNHALKDRLSMFELSADIDIWTKWAQSEAETEEGESVTMIDNTVIEYLASNPEMLHQVNDTADVLPTPRSWEKVSNIKRFFDYNKSNYDKQSLASAIAGTVGTTAAYSYMNFLESKNNPLISPEEIFTGKKNTDELIKRIKNEEIARLTVSSRNISRYFSKMTKEDRKNKKFLDNYVTFLENIPRDTMLGVLKSIHDDWKEEVFNYLINSKDFVELYYSVVKQLR